MNEKTVLITGATGFLGEYLVKRLAKDYQVFALGRNRNQGKKLEQLGAVFCQADFTNRQKCAKYFKGVTYVIHAGALSSVWGKWEDFYKTNVLGTAIVSDLCLEYKVKRLVYISSPSVYTVKHDQFHIRENQAPSRNELNYYIKSKIMAEQVIRQQNRRGLETVILRPRGLIGIGDTSLVPRLLRANARIGIPLMGGGHNMVDLTSVENVALACQLSLTAEAANGEVFNITNGEPMEFKTLLDQFLSAIGEKPHYRRLPFQMVYGAAAGMEWIYRTLRLPGEPPLTRYTACTLGFSQTLDIQKARRILGYQPEKTLSQTIVEYGQWWRLNKEPPHNDPRVPPSAISRVKLYHCGSCTNDLKFLFKGHPREKRDFPAMAALIQHNTLGNILFDTGYSKLIYKDRFPMKLYCLLNPVHIESGQTIGERLQGEGIRKESIKTIILSHAHPDHIGGLTDFSGYRLLATKAVLKQVERPQNRNLVFRDLLPKTSAVKYKCEPENQLVNHFLCKYFQQVYDLFGDGSVVGVVLNGHCKGQLGIYIPDFKLFLAADACWGGDLVCHTLNMRILPRLIQKHFMEYKKTLQGLCDLKRDYPDVRIMFSHQRGGEMTYGGSAIRS